MEQALDPYLVPYGVLQERLSVVGVVLELPLIARDGARRDRRLLARGAVHDVPCTAAEGGRLQVKRRGRVRERLRGDPEFIRLREDVCERLLLLRCGRPTDHT